MEKAFVRLSNKHKQRTVYMAGKDVSRAISLLKNDAKSVVCGCGRSWTGVDVPNMRLVYVERLPYASDFKPRSDIMDMCRLKGLSRKYSREDMLQQLLQGMGRLIRSHTSNGKVYISDSRAYGAVRVIKTAFPGAEVIYLNKQTMAQQ